MGNCDKLGGGGGAAVAYTNLANLARTFLKWGGGWNFDLSSGPPGHQQRAAPANGHGFDPEQGLFAGSGVQVATMGRKWQK